MSLHINIDYILSNIVFVRLDTKYVFIEKHAWNTMVTIFFTPESRTKENLRQLKILIFDLYYEVNVLGKQLDRNKTNNQLLLMIEPKLDQEIEEIRLKDSVDADLKFDFNDESEHVFQHYINPKSKELFSQKERQHLINIGHIYEECEWMIKDEINLISSSFNFTDALVKSIGFNKLKNMLMNFLVEDCIYARSDVEQKFIKYITYSENSILLRLRHMKMIIKSNCLSCTCENCRNEPGLQLSRCGNCSLHNECDYHSDYEYVCTECWCVNQHGGDHGRFDPYSKYRTKIKHKVLFFDEKGFYYEPKIKLTQFALDKKRSDNEKRIELADKASNNAFVSSLMSSSKIDVLEIKEAPDEDYRGKGIGNTWMQCIVDEHNRDESIVKKDEIKEVETIALISPPEVLSFGLINDNQNVSNEIEHEPEEVVEAINDNPLNLWGFSNIQPVTIKKFG